MQNPPRMGRSEKMQMMNDGVVMEMEIEYSYKSFKIYHFA